MYKISIVLIFVISIFIKSTFANLYVVGNTNSNGPNSLDSAVNQAVMNPGPDTIGFNPILMGSTIILNTSLMIVGAPANADATTIMGDIDFDGKPDIEIVGINATFPGILIGASNCVVSGMVISGFSNGILVDGANYPGINNNAIVSNFIGTNFPGDAVAVQVNINAGIFIKEAKSITIGSTISPIHRNVISGNGGPGILIKGSDSIRILGNLIGTDMFGTGAVPNQFEGIAVDSFSNFIEIGNEASLGKNLISGNMAAGILVNNNISSVRIVNNYIGTNLTGDDSLPNAPGIILQDSVSEILIGSSNLNGGNLISGNRIAGVHLFSTGPLSAPKFVQFFGNNIGLQMDRITPLSNKGSGIMINSGKMIQIGDGTINGRNIISANTQEGIFLDENSGSSYTKNITIVGNHIGTDWSGNISVGNGFDGISMFSGTAFLDSINIGDGTIQGRNIISGNMGSGILISGIPQNSIILGPNRISINNNLIGVGINGITSLGNNFNGVTIDSVVQKNRIENNIIAHNGLNGIDLIGGNTTFENSFFANSIHDNGVQGILIETTTNANIFAPVIDSIALDSTLFGQAIPNALVQVYADSFGQGRVYFDTVSADNAGNWQLKVPFLPHTMEFTTLQDSAGNTSMFSLPFGGYFMYGSVFNGVNTDTISTGAVFLYLKEPGINSPYKLIDSANIGDLNINEFDLGPYFPSEYLLLGVPDITMYPNTLPTYYKSSTRWFEADALILANDTNVNITAELIIPQAGTGTIKGKIKKGQGVGKIQGPGDPFNGIDVSLIDKSTGSAVARTISDIDPIIPTDSGVFVFNNVIDGNYIIHADIAGIPIDTNTIYTIDATNQDVTNILVTVDSNFISFSTTTGLEDNNLIQEELNIFPNPLRGEAFIGYKVDKNKYVELQLFNITGHKVRTLVAQQHSVGKYIYIVNAKTLNLESGNYFIEMVTDDQKVTRKFVVIE